jgi:hypothetical protein
LGVPTDVSQDISPPESDGGTPEAAAAVPAAGVWRIRGWLMLLCISLLLVRPLSAAYAVMELSSTAARLAGRFPGFVVTTATSSVLILGLAGFGVYVGVQLVRRRPGAVSAAKAFLWVNLVGGAVVAAAPFAAGLPAAGNRAMVPFSVQEIVSGLFYFGVWYSYLTFSKRVRAVYGGADSATVEGPDFSPSQPLPPDEPFLFDEPVLAPVEPTRTEATQRAGFSWSRVWGWLLLVLGAIGLAVGVFALSVGFGDLVQPGEDPLELVLTLLVAVVSPLALCLFMIARGRRLLLRSRDSETPARTSAPS